MFERFPPLSPLRARSFRLQWVADLSTAWALEMEVLILGWYVLVESGSVVLLTVFGALMYIGTLLAPLMGTFADRLGLRQVLALMRLSYAILAGTILVLAALGWLSPSAVLAVAFVVGLIKPSDIGLRSALAGASVPAQMLVPAMSLSRTTGDSARVGGALAGAGFMASLGMVSAYWVVVTLYLLGTALTLRAGRYAPAATRPHTPAADDASSALRELFDGLKHVWHTPTLRALMLLAALVNFSAFPLSGGLMPYIARDVFGLDQAGLGRLVASYASGALVGSLALGSLGARLPPARTMLVACVLWHLSLLGLALPVSAGVAMGLYFAAGFHQSLSMLSLFVILMRQAEPRLRGRVMGARMLAIYTLPFGLMAAGVLIPAIGFPALVGLYVSLGLGLTAAIAWTWRPLLLPPRASANLHNAS